MSEIRPSNLCNPVMPTPPDGYRWAIVVNKYFKDIDDLVLQVSKNNKWNVVYQQSLEFHEGFEEKYSYQHFTVMVAHDLLDKLAKSNRNSIEQQITRKAINNAL